MATLSKWNLAFSPVKLVLNTVIKMQKNEFCLNFYTAVLNTNLTTLYVYDVIGQRWVRIRIGNGDRSIQLMNLDGTNVTSTQVTLEYHIDF